MGIATATDTMQRRRSEVLLAKVVRRGGRRISRGTLTDMSDASDTPLCRGAKYRIQ